MSDSNVEVTEMSHLRDWLDIGCWGPAVSYSVRRDWLTPCMLLVYSSTEDESEDREESELIGRNKVLL
jgi:hypothetical protein